MRTIALPDGLSVFGLNPDEARFMHSEVFGARCYLQHGVELHDEDCVVDVGANIGMATLFFHRERKGVRIFAFEPNPAAAGCLRANIELYGINARVFDCGLMSEPGTAEFTLYPANTVASGFRADADHEREITRTYMINNGVAPHGADRFVEALYRREEKFVCPVRTLSEIVDEERLERIDLLKINVERTEREVLGGIRQDHWMRIRQVAMEVTDLGGGLSAVVEMLRSLGFRVVVEQEPRLQGTPIYNLFATKLPGQEIV
ncbi:MAG TPA: FkbM family methyltransferase [Acidobacteriaceae bacterium]|nr:FkbM family methyltransferase [Acidobacteriaceae bacterium]